MGTTITAGGHARLRPRLRPAVISVAAALVAALFSVVSAPPASALPITGKPPADLVFVVDESGSMGDDQADVRANAARIADDLAAFVDPRFALVGFGTDGAHGPGGAPYTHTDFTTAAAFTTALGTLVANGGFEPGVEATTFAMRNLSFRPTARSCVVLITDEDSDGGDVATARAELAAKKATFFGIVALGSGNTATTYGPAPGSLAAESGGRVFGIGEFRADPTPVLDAILSDCIRASALAPGSSSFGQPPSAGWIGEPVNTATGNFVEPRTDLAFPAQAGGLGWSRTYNSLDTAVGALGPGWTTSYSSSFASLPNGDAILVEPDGRRLLFAANGVGGWARPADFAGDAVANADGTRTIRFFDGTAWDFDAGGALLRTTDGAGGTVTVGRDGAGAVASATSSAGYTLAFAYDTEGRLASVTASDGRVVRYGFDPAGALVAATAADGSTERYEVDGLGRITAVRDGAGRLLVENTYDDQSRVATQTVPSGRPIRFSYDDATRTTVVTDAVTGADLRFVHDEAGRLVSATDPAGKAVSKTYDAAGNLVSVTDRTGAVTTQRFEGGDLVERAGPGGVVERASYDALHRVVSYTDAAGG